ncbi:transcriptional regulator [Marinomonas mediterranea]|jgi:hypothetical protein|uniref:CI repressor n=1 Tax=Marinomonas mediterranea (strain ATCC 700492 / JCM 21426 / NBRC 103028 / MMB-1) TaxID=717774 RepID=F2K1E1_MARM1|nr:helix-turn-helix domain-containing protein [Marinomonas mediterranea]ADZ91072.1 hypothetical protein Marme_1816 [Marinomonas mediterranea MMB-1]WCN13136.1 transcriptional regulator [Marinomonas mediterranea]WCN17207.1 transcriptional regulator [Marinomonas mediterranea MMB-1]
MTAIQKAIETVGGQTALAENLGVKQAHVWNWLWRNKRAPAKYIRQISKATNGSVSESDLLRDHEQQAIKD